MPDEATENAGSTSARVSSFFIEDLLGTEGTAGGGARRAAAGGGGRGGPRCGPRSPLRLGAPGCPLRDAAVGWYRRAHAAFLGCASPDTSDRDSPELPEEPAERAGGGRAGGGEGPAGRLGAGRAGRLAAPHRDAGEDLVPEPPQQVEAAAGGRPRGGHLSHAAQRIVRVPILYHENSPASALGFTLPHMSPPLVGFSSGVSYPLGTFPAASLPFLRSQMTGLV
ncbi:unnamed protein product [Bubo scandiacus]